MCLLLLTWGRLSAGQEPLEKRLYVLSNVYTIDRKYRSMEGPSSVQTVYLGDRAHPELLWIVGIRTEMVAEDGVTPQLPEHTLLVVAPVGGDQISITVRHDQHFADGGIESVSQ